MEPVKVVLIKEDVISRNNQEAASIRSRLSERGVFLLNVMSSPGSGKTTLLTALINRLKSRYRIGVIEADIDGQVDAETIAERTGVKAIQMHTGGACHITCQMSREALEALGVEGLDLVILENIGNLVCPAEFDTGAHCNLVLLSVPEGDDKPLKYPLMFEVANLVALTKLDVAPIFDFDVERAEANIARRNTSAEVFPVCAPRGEGIDALADALIARIEGNKRTR